MGFLSEKAMWIEVAVLVWQGFFFCSGDLQRWPLWKKVRDCPVLDSQFQMALDPSQAKAEPISEVIVASVKMCLRKDRKLHRGGGNNLERTRLPLRERKRESEGNSKRALRSEVQEVLYGRPNIPEGTELMEDPHQTKEQQKEPLCPDCKYHHPSTTAVPCLTEGTEHIL